MADTKLTGLTAQSPPLGTDIVYLVHDPGGTPASKKCTVTDLVALAPATGLWKFLGTLDLTGATSPAEITTIGTSSHTQLLVQLYNITPASNNVNLYLKVKIAGGVQSASYQWVKSTYNSNGGSGTRNSNGDTNGIELGYNISNNAANDLSGHINIYGPHGATRKRMDYRTTYYENGASHILTDFGGGTWDGGNDDLTGLDFVLSSGNFSTGTVNIWGLTTS